MCTATSALALQGGGAATSAVGAYYGAQGQKAGFEGQAAIQEINARASDEAARGALLMGERASTAQKLRSARLKATQTTTLAANGVDLGEGSPLRTLTDTDALGQLDAITIEANAVRSAWGYKTEATNYRNDALMRGAAAGAISPETAFATSLLGSAGSVASSWYNISGKGG